MTGKKWKAAVLGLALFAASGICGCEEKVITVSSVLDDDGQTADYIEIQEFELKEVKEKESNRAKVQYCAVLIPEEYHESDEIPGMYFHERAPLDSSNIYYTVSEGSGQGRVSDALTEKKYKEIIEEAFKKNGQEGRFTVDSFEEMDMDGVPAYKIRSTYVTQENEIQQLTYLVLAENTYTITYSQAEDDDLIADFEISDGKIKLVKENEVETARADED
ncbi:MAG: hypothetical protein HDR23_04860 [Lachnospiraceae bacterium]|nr:hypothetical protein [Lachnospiraceae bacterium]